MTKSRAVRRTRRVAIGQRTNGDAATCPTLSVARREGVAPTQPTASATVSVEYKVTSLDCKASYLVDGKRINGVCDDRKADSERRIPIAVRRVRK